MLIHNVAERNEAANRRMEALLYFLKEETFSDFLTLKKVVGYKGRHNHAMYNLLNKAVALGFLSKHEYPVLTGKVEVDSRIFGADPEASSRDGTEWFNSLNEAGRALWLYEAHSTRPRDAWATYLLRRAYRLAQEAGQEWKTG